MADPAFAQVQDNPHFKVRVGGGDLPAAAAADILEVTVGHHVEGADVFSVTFSNWDFERQRLTWTEDELLREGAEVDVQAGYAESLHSLIVGEVTALEPEFPPDETPLLTIRGYDRLHRLRRGRKTRSFTKMKDSEAAAKIARELGLKIEADDSQVVHEYLLQNNQSDIDFLLERARRIRYEVKVQGTTLSFRKAADDRTKVVSLKYGVTLQSFAPRLNTLQQVSEVAVQGWSPKRREPIAGKAQKGDAKAAGDTLGAALAERAFFAAKAAVVDHPVGSAQEAAQIAKARFNDLAMEFVTGEGVAVGEPALRAGRVVELLGLGKRFSGAYYLTSTLHRVGPAGYNTAFTVARNAV